MSSTQPFSLRLWLLSQTPATGEQIRCRNFTSITRRFIFSHDFPTAGCRKKGGGSQSHSLRCSWVHVLCPPIRLCLFSHAHTQWNLALNLFLPLSFLPFCSTAQLSTVCQERNVSAPTLHSVVINESKNHSHLLRQSLQDIKFSRSPLYFYDSSLYLPSSLFKSFHHMFALQILPPPHPPPAPQHPSSTTHLEPPLLWTSGEHCSPPRHWPPYLTAAWVLSLAGL